MGIYIPGLSHSLGVNVFSYAMRNSWQNQFIFPCDGVQHRKGSDGGKLLILWEKYGYQFPRLSPQDGFCCILPCYGKLTARPMHFTYEEMRYPNCFLCISLDGARLPSRFVRFFIHVIPTTPIPPPSDKYSTLECVFPRIKGASFVSPGSFTNTPFLRSQNS